MFQPLLCISAIISQISVLACSVTRLSNSNLVFPGDVTQIRVFCRFVWTHKSDHHPLLLIHTWVSSGYGPKFDISLIYGHAFFLFHSFWCDVMWIESWFGFGSACVTIFCTKVRFKNKELHPCISFDQWKGLPTSQDYKYIHYNSMNDISFHTVLTGGFVCLCHIQICGVLLVPHAVCDHLNSNQVTRWFIYCNEILQINLLLLET